MNYSPLPPEAKHKAEVYVQCLRRAERRIILGGQMANGRGVNLDRFFLQRPLIEHINRCIRARGVEGHATALIRLQIKRSILAAQLEGLQW